MEILQGLDLMLLCDLYQKRRAVNFHEFLVIFKDQMKYAPQE